MGIGDWGLGIGDWGLGPIPNPHAHKFFDYLNLLNNVYKSIIKNKIKKCRKEKKLNGKKKIKL